MEDNQFYAELFTEMLSQDKERDELLLKIDDGIACKYEVPAELSALPWIKNRKLAQTHLSDAVNAAIRPFASRAPRLDIQPLSEDDAEYERVEMLRNAMEWETERMNRYGEKSAHWQIVESAMRYNKVCIQTEYLPYKFKGRKDDKRIKSLLKTRNFSWNVHHPASVHARFSDMGLEGVLKCCLMSAQDLIDMFGKDNKGVKKLLKEFDEAGGGDLISSFYTFVDYMDWDVRVQAATGGAKGAGESIDREFDGLDYEFSKKERADNFIPWVIVDGGDPLLQSVIESGMWDNYLHMKTIEFAKGIELAAQSHLMFQTTDGTLKNVYIDYTNPTQPMVTDLTARVTQLEPASVDPNFSKVLSDIENNIYSSTTQRILADVGRYGSSAMGTIQTIIQASLAQLAGMQYTIERAESLAFLQNFQWIDQSQMSLVTFNAETSKPDVQYMKKGAQVLIKAGPRPADAPPNWIYFDPDILYLSVKVEPNSLTDEQAKLNSAIQMVHNLGASYEMIYDKFNLGNYDMHEVKRAAEDLNMAEVEKEKQKILLEIEALKMKLQIEAQKAMQPPQSPQSPQSSQSPQQQVQSLNAGGNYASMQGVQTQGGGIAPQTSAPMESRNTIQGQNNNGTSLA